MRIMVAAAVALLGFMLGAGAASAEIGTADNVPAATLLVPYFEVDINNANSQTTLLSINNASNQAMLAHVTLWTDWGIPTLAFQVYLTGYDVQTINLRDVFNGSLPVTADGGLDPDTPGPSGSSTISNQGSLSVPDASGDKDFPGAVGPCAVPYNQPDPTLAAKIANARAAHTGQFGALFNGCAGADYGDGVARGYVTIDNVNSCSLLFPSDPGYFAPLGTGIANNVNALWGDVIHVNPAQNFAQGETAVHIEACLGPAYVGSVGTGAGRCPFAAGEYTFYGRFFAPATTDEREPLATTFATRFINGGAFSGGTQLDVFRDTKTTPTGVNGPQACGGAPGWFPLAQTDVVSFDEQENPTDQCVMVGNVSPVTGGGQACFPLATQRIDTAGGNQIASDLGIPSPFGWLYLNLNFALASSDPYPGVAQAWVTTLMSGEGRFGVGFNAIKLDTALDTIASGQVLLP